MATEQSTTAPIPVVHETLDDLRNDVCERVDELNSKLGQLDTLLGMISGEGLDFFLRTNRTRQDDYLQCCLDLVAKSKRAVDDIYKMV